MEKEVNLNKMKFSSNLLSCSLFYVSVALLFVVPLFTSSSMLQESNVAIEKALRTLAKFCSGARPSATMIDEAIATILRDFNITEASSSGQTFH